MEWSKKKRRILILWLIGVFIIILAFILGPVVYGWYITKQYVPDLLEAYQNVDVLQNEVAFGTIEKGTVSIRIVIALVAISLFTLVIYRMFSKA